MNIIQHTDFFKLFSCCEIVKGFARTIVYDLQRKEFHFVPNYMYDILSIYKEKSILEIKNLYDEESHEIIDKGFQYFFDNELAFPCNEMDLSFFPDINLNWETPNILEMFILDIDNKSNHDFTAIFNQLSLIALKIIQLRFFYVINFDSLNRIMQMIKDTDIRTIELIHPYNHSISKDDWMKLIDDNLKLISITIYNSIESSIDYRKQAILIQTKDKITSHNDCGKISKSSFMCNLNLYTESQKFNTCLNCKASIDVFGEIKNCPSMNYGFGHYKDVSLIETVKKQEFQKLWKIKKDDIVVCQDCEFRYMCTDCRAYIKDPNNIYSQPAKCAYNPYIAKWEFEKDYCSVDDWIKNRI
jgi:SPASM domain peptide maturase of grasp-with-spasm system